jgi:hypothetical protein
MTMHNTWPMAKDILTAGDLCDEAQDIYNDCLEPHYTIPPEKISKAEAKKIEYIQKILREIGEIQALTLYVAQTQGTGNAAHEILPFRKCELLNDQGPYLDIVLREQTSRYIYTMIHELHSKVEIDIAGW